MQVMAGVAVQAPGLRVAGRLNSGVRPLGPLMPIGDIAGEALGGIFRFIGRILFEMVFEVVIRGTGYALVRLFRPQADPSDTACAVVGLSVWVGAAVGGFWLYRHLAAA